MPDEAVPVGGQAVPGGVMMRGATSWSVAVRTPDGSIEVDVHPLPSSAVGWRNVPVVRGVVALGESLSLGLRAILWATNRSVPGASISASGMARQAALGVVIAIAVFLVAPAAAARLLAGGGGIRFHVLEGLLGVGLLLAYLAAIGRLAPVRELFGYHGAEHQAVAAHEAGAALTAEAAASFTTRHARCGTSFLLTVVVVSAVVQAAVGYPAWPVLLASRVLTVPLVAGLSYELLRAGAANLDRRWVRWSIAPGLALQGLTTRTPRADQLEVALAALRAVVESPAPAGAQLSSAPRPVLAPVAVATR